MPFPVESSPRECYDDEERKSVERYIEDAFGPVARTYYDADGEGITVDIAVTEPDEERRFYTLTTIGMGACQMDIPEELRERNQAFAELTICLPPDWDLMRDSWPFHVLKETARRPFREHDHLHAGNAYRGTMMERSGFTAVFVVPAAARDGISTHMMLPSGKIVNFFLLLPIFRDEWDFILDKQDAFAFWERYSERIGSIMADPERESCIWADETEEDAEWNT